MIHPGAGSVNVRGRVNSVATQVVGGEAPSQRHIENGLPGSDRGRLPWSDVHREVAPIGFEPAPPPLEATSVLSVKATVVQTL